MSTTQEVESESRAAPEALLHLAPRLAPRFAPLSPARRRWMITAVLLALDALMLSLAFFLAAVLRFRVLPYYGAFDLPAYLALVAAAIPGWLALFALMQTYNRDYLFSGLSEYTQVFYAVTAGMLAVMVFGFLGRFPATISRGWLLLAWLLALIFVVVARFSFRRLVYALRQRGHLLSPALVVGANEEGLALGQQLSSWGTSGLYIAGYIDDHADPGAKLLGKYPLLGSLEEIIEIVQAQQIQEVIVAPTAISREQLLDLFRTFAVHPQVKLRLSSGLFEVASLGMKVRELAYVPLIEFNAMRMSGLDWALKLALDYAVVSVALLPALLVIGLLALLVRLDSPGPAFYRRRVMGVNGVQFDAFKLRSMYVNGDEILEQYPEKKAEWLQEFKIKDDPRITRVGKWLRKFSLDELPQIINVLLNQMSIVGPRMITPPEMEKYGKWGMNLLTVKPGITGLWQVSGRSDVTYEERVRIDMEYIRNWTIWLDIYILFRTPITVIFKRGAY